MLPDYWGDTSPLFPLGFAPTLIEFPKNIGKSRDKSYPTNQKTSSIPVPTQAERFAQHVSNFFSRAVSFIFLFA